MGKINVRLLRKLVGFGAAAAGRFRRGLGRIALVGLFIAASFAMVKKEQIGEAVASVLADPGSILALRSPGGRAGGALTQTKAPHRIAAVTPTERVLSGTRTRPTDALPGSPYGPVDDLFPVVPGEDFLDGAPLGSLGPLGEDASSVPIGFFTPGRPGTLPFEGVDTNPTPAVPEPDSWATMFVGLLTVAALLRRRQVWRRERKRIAR